MKLCINHLRCSHIKWSEKNPICRATISSDNNKMTKFIQIFQSIWHKKFFSLLHLRVKLIKCHSIKQFLLLSLPLERIKIPFFLQFEDLFCRHWKSFYVFCSEFAYFIVIQISFRLYRWFCLQHVSCLKHQRRAFSMCQ